MRMNRACQCLGSTFFMVSGMVVLIAVLCASGLGMVAVMYWQLYRQFVCGYSWSYSDCLDIIVCIKIHQCLNTVEENQADLMGQDGFSAPHWRAGSKTVRSRIEAC